MEVPKTLLPLNSAFRDALNRHGYAFQFSVIRAAENLYEDGKSKWIFEVAEFPVAAQGKDTRIDLVLRKRDSLTYAIAECKRVNPALGHWCFARAAYTRRDPNSEKLLVESLDAISLVDVKAIDPKQPYKLLNTVSSARSKNIYHLGFELKSDEKGDPNSSSDRGAIEEAATQVLRGANGMFEYIATHQFLEPGYKVSLVPVIFTTANLWTSEVDLGGANLTNGNMAEIMPLTPRSWLWFNYNQSPTLKHSLGTKEPWNSLGDILESEYTRSIAVVNAAGIEEFLHECKF